MIKKKFIPIVILIVICFLTAFYFLFIQNNSANLIKNINHKTSIVNIDNKQLKTNTRNLNKTLSEVNLENNNVNVLFTDNVQKAVFKQKRDDVIISGFWIEINEPSLTIYIYINSSLNQKDRLHEINRNFITGLFYLDEYLVSKKTIGNPVNYGKSVTNAHRFFMDSINENKLPILEE